MHENIDILVSVRVAQKIDNLFRDVGQINNMKYNPALTEKSADIPTTENNVFFRTI